MSASLQKAVALLAESAGPFDAACMLLRGLLQPGSGREMCSDPRCPQSIPHYEAECPTCVQSSPKVDTSAQDAIDRASDERDAAIIEHAQDTLAEDGKLEIDLDAKVSHGDDNGAYVSAWVWVPFHGTIFDKEGAVQ